MSKFISTSQIGNSKRFTCVCECGRITTLFQSQLERRISCGCGSVTRRGVQGEVKHIDGKRVASPEYRCWQLMKNRTLNEKCKDWKYYGGRGIQLCASWHEFENFLSDMGRKPTPKHTLDRVDGDGHYELRNCRWATRLDQSRNREYASVGAWEVAAALGLSMKTVYHMMWECREKDKGNTKHFSLSPENEARIRVFMKDKSCAPA